MAHPAVQQTFQSDPAYRLIETDAAHAARRAREPVAKGSAYRQMRKKAGMLKHVTTAPPLRRHEDPAGGALPHFIADAQVTTTTLQTRNAAQQGRLARPGRAEHSGHPRIRHMQLSAQFEVPEHDSKAAVDAAHRRDTPKRRF